jgi:hypothetical protein
LSKSGLHRGFRAIAFGAVNAVFAETACFT